jgi:hypothetical protein
MANYFEIIYKDIFSYVSKHKELRLPRMKFRINKESCTMLNRKSTVQERDATMFNSSNWPGA